MASSGSHMAGGSSSSAGWSASSFVAKGTSEVYVSGVADLLKQVEQLMAMAEKEKLL